MVKEKSVKKKRRMDRPIKRRRTSFWKLYGNHFNHDLLKSKRNILLYKESWVNTRHSWNFLNKRIINWRFINSSDDLQVHTKKHPKKERPMEKGSKRYLNDSTIKKLMRRNLSTTPHETQKLRPVTEKLVKWRK